MNNLNADMGHALREHYLFLKQNYTYTPSTLHIFSYRNSFHSDSEMPLRRRIPATPTIKPPHPSHRLHRKLVIRRSSKNHPKLIKRCNSEPALVTAGDDHRPPGHTCSIVQTRISTDLFSSSPELLPNSPEKSKRMMHGYNRDAKVVVKVMVEGSVGPIRALVKLGSSVDETIRLVMNKYNDEGRSPRLDQDAITSFELHHSYFDLECLDKSNMIGEIGSRSFYMRKSVTDKEDMCFNTSIDLDNDDSSSPISSVFFRGLICQEFKKIILRMSSRIWRLLGCFDG